MNDGGLTVSPWAEGHVVRVLGKGTLQESTSFREAVVRCLKFGPASRVMVDLSGCHYIDSTFMGAMIWLHKHAGESRPDRLQFCADTSKCHQLFAHGLLDRVLNIVPTCPPITGDPIDLARMKDDEPRNRLARLRR